MRTICLVRTTSLIAAAYKENIKTRKYKDREYML